MVEPVRAGRDPDNLAREFKPTARSIRNWMARADKKECRLADGWLYEPDTATRHDRAHGLFLEDLAAWVQATQPEAWEALTKTQGAAAGLALADRLRATLDRQGTLDVLRQRLDITGLRRPILLVQVRPALAMNPALAERYAANRLRLVRQVR